MANTSTDHWSAQAYQEAAAFVPKLTSEVVEWLDARPGESVLDVGCGDGLLTIKIGRSLMPGGKIHGIDSSNDMILAAKSRFATEKDLKAADGSVTFEVFNGNSLLSKPELQTSPFDKVFSNAAMHWILGSSTSHQDFFHGINKALKPGGKFVFEMGGMGNVAEMRTAFLSTISKRIGIEDARKADPWFFPTEEWMRGMLEESGFVVEKSELQYRRTQAESGDGGGVEGWTRLMGKQFFDAIDEDEREKCILEAMEVLRTVVTAPDGKQFIGYVRLRAVARKL